MLRRATVPAMNSTRTNVKQQKFCLDAFSSNVICDDHFGILGGFGCLFSELRSWNAAGIVNNTIEEYEIFPGMSDHGGSCPTKIRRAL